MFCVVERSTLRRVVPTSRGLVRPSVLTCILVNFCFSATAFFFSVSPGKNVIKAVVTILAATGAFGTFRDL